MALRLNVGGIVFQTSRSTLTNYDCMFRRMLKSGNLLRIDEYGCILIDRDPTHFRYILNFLRDGKVELPSDPKKVQEILKEAEYYSIQELINFCKKKIETPKDTYRFVRNNAELKEILNDATRGVCVITCPGLFGNRYNYSPINRLVQKYKNKVDIVVIAGPYTEKNRDILWNYVYVPFGQPYRPTFVSSKHDNYFETMTEIDQLLSSL